MTETIYNLLSVTRGLDSLELIATQTGTSDAVTVQTGCLASLTQSYSTLKHLRLLRFGTALDERRNVQSDTDLSKFKALKISGMDYMTLLLLNRWNPTISPKKPRNLTFNLL